MAYVTIGVSDPAFERLRNDIREKLQEAKEERRALFYRLEVGITLQRHYRGWMVTWPFSSQAGAWDGRTYTEEYFETGAQFDESGYRKAQRHVRYLKARLRAEFRAGSEGLTAAALKEWESDWYEADRSRQAMRSKQ